MTNAQDYPPGSTVIVTGSGYTPGETAPHAVFPVIVRHHSAGYCSITGGVVVRDPSLPALRGRYLFGDLPIVAARARVEAGDDPFPVLLLAVLAHLPLAFEARDHKTEADDAARHHVDVALRRIG